MNKNKRGADKIITSLTGQIANGKLNNGDRLPAEAKLCETYNVSRTVVREAIQQLKAMGVIHTITGSGSYITEGKLTGIQNSLQMYSAMTGDSESWIELLEIRILLESDCVRRLASSHFSQKVVDLLQANLDEMEQNKHDVEKYTQSDIKLHQLFIVHSGNKIVTAIISALENIHLRFAKETYGKQNPDRCIEINFTEHKAIVDAIIDRDPIAAEAAMKHHLSASMDNLMRFIADSEE